MSKNSTPLRSLTGIRGVAAVWVVLFHMGQGTPVYSLAPWLYASPLVRNGFRGVDLFFILSGFIMMHAHRRDFATIRMTRLKQFAGARLIRIYPVNFVVLLLILAVVASLPAYVAWVRFWVGAFGEEAYTPISFFQTATLSVRWLMRDFGLWNSVTWSLSVELLAYTTLPPLVFCLTRTRSAAVSLFIAAASLAGMLGLLAAFGNLDGGSPNRLGILRGLGGFAAGAAMRHYVSNATVSENQPKLVALASVAAIAGLAYSDFAVLMPFPFATLIASLSYERGVINALLSHPISMFVGKISFSLYLVHLTPLLVLEWMFASGHFSPTLFHIVVGILCYCIVVLVLSFGLYTFAERPCQRLSRTLFKSGLEAASAGVLTPA